MAVAAAAHGDNLVMDAGEDVGFHGYGAAELLAPAVDFVDGLLYAVFSLVGTLLSQDTLGVSEQRRVILGVECFQISLPEVA